jgi:hypothetical protein
MMLEPQRIRLFVDGKLVKEQAIPARTRSPVPGELAIGRTVEDGIGCDGLIDDVRISRGVREISAAPAAALTRDDATLGLWPLDEVTKTAAASLPEREPLDPAAHPLHTDPINRDRIYVAYLELVIALFRYNPADPEAPAALLRRCAELVDVAINEDEMSALLGYGFAFRVVDAARLSGPAATADFVALIARFENRVGPRMESVRAAGRLLSDPAIFLAWSDAGQKDNGSADWTSQRMAAAVETGDTARARLEARALVTNPPYGIRLAKSNELEAFYPRLGDALKRRFAGWTAWLITGDVRLAKLIGLKPERRIPLWNGSIECRLLAFRLVAGSMRTPVIR